MRLLQAIEGYRLSAGANHLSKTTLELYSWAILRLADFLHDPEIEKVTMDDLDHFFVWLENDYQPQGKDRLSTSSIANTWKGLRSFFGWAYKRRVIKSDPSLEIEMPDNPEVEIWPYTENEIKLMFDGCTRKKQAVTPNGTPYVMKRSTAVRDTALISILVDTGIRSSECCRLQIEDIDLKTGAVWVAPFGTRRKSKGRHVYISEVTRHNLWLHLVGKESGYVFLTINKRPFDRNSLKEAIQHICKDSGISGPTVHRFRHTFAVQYILNGGDPFTLMHLLGHTTMRMVNRYLQFTRADLAASHQKASPMEKWFGKKY